jgi:hypothetical protein
MFFKGMLLGMSTTLLMLFSFFVCVWNKRKKAEKKRKKRNKNEMRTKHNKEKKRRLLIRILF